VGGKDYKTIVLSGDGAEAWKPAAEKEASPIPVEIWDVAKTCALKDNDSSSLFAIGAALRNRVPSGLALDISGISSAAKLEKQVRSYVRNVTLMAGGFLLVLSLLTQVRLMMVNSKLSSLSADIEGTDLSGNDPDAIKAKLDRMQTSVKVLSMMLTGSTPLAPKLSVVAEHIPPALWIEDITYASPVSVSEAVGTTTELKFSGETYLKGDDKVRVVDGFSKTLKAAPEFKSFGRPSGGIDFTNDSEASQAAGQPTVLGQPEAPKPTGFSVVCTTGRG
jgi:hypothetical protein